jgi:hypothetical protein
MIDGINFNKTVKSGSFRKEDNAVAVLTVMQSAYLQLIKARLVTSMTKEKFNANIIYLENKFQVNSNKDEIYNHKDKTPISDEY